MVDIEKCKKCEFAIGNKSKPNELGCIKTFYWTVVEYLYECPLNSK